DIGSARYSLCEKDTWICFVAADGREMPQITYDPLQQTVDFRADLGLLRDPPLPARLDRQSDCLLRTHDHDRTHPRLAHDLDKIRPGRIWLRERRTRRTWLLGLH